MRAAGLDIVDATLQRLLADRPALGDAMERLAPPPGTRDWIKLHASATHDAWVIAWAADSELGAHDHGASHAVVRVLRGALLEWYHDPGDRATWTVRELTPGRSIVVPPTRVHEVHNATDETAYSLHIYSPPLQRMSFHTPVAQIGTSSRRRDGAPAPLVRSA